MARQVGAYVAEVNPTPSDIAGRLSEQVRGRAGDVLPALVAALREESGIGSQESGGDGRG